MAEEKRLSLREEIFVEAYLRLRNQTKAAIEAGYSVSSARNQGYRLMQKDDIREAIRARLEEFQVETNAVLLRLAERATGSMAMFVDVKDGEHVLNFDKAQKLGAMHLIKKLRHTSEKRTIGDDQEIERDVIEIELYDAQAADVQLGRYLKLFTDKIELTDPYQAMLRDIIAGAIDYESLANAFGEKYAVDAFNDAGIPIPAEAGTGTTADED